MCTLLIMLIPIALFIGSGIIARNIEKKDYNKGVCPRCGERLGCFDMASDGSRGYTCDHCSYTTWCSYDVDK